MCRKIVLVRGTFDILHPGHIRLLKFAKECGDKLVVAINSDKMLASHNLVDECHRQEVLKSLECVDEVFITQESNDRLINRIKPWAVVKGKEFENQFNEEEALLKKIGGKIIFGSGEFDSLSTDLIRSTYNTAGNLNYSELKEYIHRRHIEKKQIDAYFDEINNLSVAVIGELIVDEYVQGNAIGLSQEDPTIVMTPSKKETFIGGAAITAGHIKSLGASSVSLFTVLGKDQTALYAKNNISDYGIQSFFFIDESRPTPLKTRYRADKKTLLRVNEVRQHKISIELQDTIFKAIENKLVDLDLLVFSDFNYGLLPQRLVERLCKLCENNGVSIIADSQTSSQVGDISRYHSVLLMTPTEKEVRVALNNPDDGLVILAKKLCEKSRPKNLVITLGSEGSFIYKPSEQMKNWDNDRLPAINKNAVDPAGAGDCYLATCGLLLLSGANIWEACYVASIASACQVDRLGNTPLSAKILTTALEESFNLS